MIDDNTVALEAVLSCPHSPCKCGQPDVEMMDSDEEDSGYKEERTPFTWNSPADNAQGNSEARPSRTFSMWQMPAAPVCICETCAASRATVRGDNTEALLRFPPSPSLRGAVVSPIARCISTGAIGSSSSGELPTRYLSASALPLPSPRPPEPRRLDLPRGGARRVPSCAPTRLPRSPVFIERRGGSDEKAPEAEGRRLLEVLDALNALRESEEEPASSSCIFRQFAPCETAAEPEEPNGPAEPSKYELEPSSFALLPRVRAAARRMSLTSPTTDAAIESKAKRPSSRFACAAKRLFRRRPRLPHRRAFSVQW